MLWSSGSQQVASDGEPTLLKLENRSTFQITNIWFVVTVDDIVVWTRFFTRLYTLETLKAYFISMYIKGIIIK